MSDIPLEDFDPPPLGDVPEPIYPGVVVEPVVWPFPEAAAEQDRTSVLTEAQGLVHGDRNKSYGPPVEDFTRTAGMVNAMWASKLKTPLVAEDVAMFMICVKLSRQINAPKRDNAVDGAGYFECLQWCIDAKAGSA